MTDQGFSEFRVWHDEAQRWQATGRLDEGPCWCADCIALELGADKGREEGNHD